MNISPNHAALLVLRDRSSVAHRTLEPVSLAQTTEAKLGDGTTVTCNSEGGLIYAEYGNGMRVKRNPQSVLVLSDDGYWLGDNLGRWFRLD